MNRKAWILTRWWTDSYYEVREIMVAVHLDEEQANKHQELATAELAAGHKKARRWAVHGDRWRSWRSPYDPSLSLSDLSLRSDWREGSFPVEYSIREVPLVAHVDEYLERSPEEVAVS